MQNLRFKHFSVSAIFTVGYTPNGMGVNSVMWSFLFLNLALKTLPTKSTDFPLSPAFILR